MMMKVLWFEISPPFKYVGETIPVNGWQDSLEVLLRNRSEIELTIVFEGKGESKVIDGVEYIPINPQKHWLDVIKNKYSYHNKAKKLLPQALEIVKRISPDIIHVFGSEYCWGLIAKQTEIPVVIHMQGSMPSYMNAAYPPGYNICDSILYSLFRPIRLIGLFFARHRNKTWVEQEKEVFRSVSNYMGRTEWDERIVKLFNPTSDYYKCNEALRPTFIINNKKWKFHNREKKTFITVGCGTLWKGLDTILRTATLLKESNIDFEWVVVGKMHPKGFVEYKEKNSFAENNVNLIGFTQANELINLLIESDLYIHTAYIDNSPNSICEAQYLGVPVISTNVGGIPSIVSDGYDGVLVPANDPFILASKIMSMIENVEFLKQLSENAIKKASQRHKPELIVESLLNCYNSIIKKNEKE